MRRSLRLKLIADGWIEVVQEDCSSLLPSESDKNPDRFSIGFSAAVLVRDGPSAKTWQPHGFGVGAPQLPAK